jgi:signal peptidase II
MAMLNSKVMLKPLAAAVFIALFTSGCDLSSKHWAILSTAAGPRSVIPGALDLVHWENPGMAFSLMRTWPPTLRTIILGTAALAAMAIGFYAVATRPMRRSAIVAIGLIAGGALGNLIDRAQNGTVTDFLHVHRGAFDWPAFNVADIAVTCGAILFALSKPLQEQES